MATLQELIDKTSNFLTSDTTEGFRSKAQSEKGTVTVGHGLTTSVMPGLKIGDSMTEEESRAKVKEVITPFVKKIATAVPTARPEEVVAMASLAYNAGPGRLNEQLFNAVRNKDTEAIKAIYSDFASAKNDPNNTLAKGMNSRRNLEAAYAGWIPAETLDEGTKAKLAKVMTSQAQPSALTGLRSQFNLGSTIPGYGEAIGKQQALGGMQTKPLLSIPGQSEAMKTQNIIKGTDPSTLTLPKPEGLPIDPRGATKTLASAIYKEPVKEITTDFPPTPPPTAAPVEPVEPVAPTEPPPPQAPSIGPEVVEATESNTTKTLKSLSSAFDGTAYQKQTDDLNSDITKMFSDFKQFTNAAQDDFQKEKVQQQWLEVGEKFAQALIQMGAGYYGLKKGVDMSGIKFNPTDWSSKLEASRADLKQSLGLARQTLEDELGLKTTAKAGVEKARSRAEQDKAAADELSLKTAQSMDRDAAIDADRKAREEKAALKVRDYMERITSKKLERLDKDFEKQFTNVALLDSDNESIRDRAQAQLKGFLQQDPNLLKAASKTYLFGLIKGESLDPKKTLNALQMLQDDVRTVLNLK